jgi:hypothetical protein
MAESSAAKSFAPVYRVDKFTVPAFARDEFLARVGETHRFLRTLPGLVSDCVLEKTEGAGAFNLVTIAIWRDATAVAAAKDAVASWRRATGFNPQELFARLQIEADLANYEPIEV